MRKFLFLAVAACCGSCFAPSLAQKPSQPVVRELPLDSIRLSDPCILADKPSGMYYMTGTGGMLWKSKDLKMWTGPFNVARPDTNSWMGKHPMIWAAELHAYKGRYYYFATFTNRDVKIDTVKGNVIERRACHVLVSNKPDGPYVPMKDAVYLPANMPTLDGTFWVDTGGKPYMIYCYEWLQNWDGTIEKIALKKDLSGTTGKAKLLFRASEAPWSREKDERGKIIPNKVTDGPWLFRTQTGKLGMLWTSWIFNVYTQGVVYSKSGTLDGPWIQEQEPITPPNHGHGMLFRTFEGKLLMSVHSHREDKDGHYIRVPRLFEVDDSGDKIKLGRCINPPAATADIFEKITGEKKISSYHGYECADFRFMGRSCKVVKPRKVAPGAPWIWNCRFWNVEPQTEKALLDSGFHVAYCDVAELFGNREAVDIWNAFYARLTQAGLSEKVCLEGFSRGGVYAYRWAAENPEKVACVYADAPVLDLKSWPGGKGTSKGDADSWAAFKSDFNLTSEEAAVAFKGNPIDLVPEIVKGRYPMLHVVGDADDVVPVAENTALFEEKVKQAGGNITVIHKPGVNHHPHSLVNPQPIVDFIMKAVR